MSNGLRLTDLIISIWVACVAGVKRGGRESKKEKEGGKERGSLLLFLTLHPLPPFNACHAG